MPAPTPEPAPTPAPEAAISVADFEAFMAQVDKLAADLIAKAG